jgi:hypothetical protein
MGVSRVLRREGTSGVSANLPPVPANGLQSRADGLAACVEGLAAALRESPISEESAYRLLSHASTAALQALTLELLLDQPRPAAVAADKPAALVALSVVPVKAAA